MKSLIASAKRELTNIKKNATVDEIQKLIGYIDQLNGDDTHLCVYGLMTGYCQSRRAIELIEECASIYKIQGTDALGTRGGIYLNNSIQDFVKHKQRTNNSIYYSKLELLTSLDKTIVQKLVKQILV